MTRRIRLRSFAVIAVRLGDGSVVYAFGASVVARNDRGAPDAYWQGQAERALRETADAQAALLSLPGALLIHAGDLSATGALNSAPVLTSTPSGDASRSTRRRSKRH